MPKETKSDLLQPFIPFVGPPELRGTGTNGQRFVNVLFETLPNEYTNETIFNCIKRPGLVNHTQPSGGAATGRGIYAWPATGHIYSVFDNKIWRDTTDMGVTLAASSGRVWFTERPTSSGTRMLIVSDGTDNYNIETNDTITQIDETDDAQFPTPNLGPIVFLDGYLLQAKSNGQIWNTDLNSVSAWTSTSFINADTHGGDLEAIHLQKDQVIAFTKNRLEFFFNNGNPTESPLQKYKQNTLGFGIAHKNTLAFSGETLCFVSENSADGDGSRRVMMIKSLNEVEEISSPVINRFLAAEGTSISTASAWMERVAGQLIYVLNLDSAERTFVYSVDNGMWVEWENAASTGKFPGAFATSLDGTIYIQDAANGRVYTLSNTTYQDSGTTFTVTLQPYRMNHGIQARKFERGLSIVGDTVSGSTVDVSWSDNDYSSFSTARTIDMSRSRKRLASTGSYYDRIYRFVNATNTAFRAKGFIPEFFVGQY